MQFSNQPPNRKSSWTATLSTVSTPGFDFIFRLTWAWHSSAPACLDIWHFWRFLYLWSPKQEKYADYIQKYTMIQKESWNIDFKKYIQSLWTPFKLTRTPGFYQKVAAFPPQLFLLQHCSLVWNTRVGWKCKKCKINILLIWIVKLL